MSDVEESITNESSGITEDDLDITKAIKIASAGPKRRVKNRKSTKLPSIERKNWLIHSHFVRKEFVACKSLIQEQLKETNGRCEYAIYIQAMMMRTEGEIQQSLELFQACHQLNPTNANNMKQIAKNLILLGKHKSAIECYNRAAEMNDKDWDISHCLGVCYHFLKQYEKAEQNFKDALSRTRHAVTYKMLAKLYADMDKIEQAMDILQKGVDFSPENTELLTSLGLLHLRNNNFHRAFELLGQALTYDPEYYKAILAVGSLMQKHGDFDVALTKYRVAAQKVPESSSLWNNIAMCFFGKQRYVAAISCLKRASYLSPFDWKILHNLSLLHLTMQQFASAFQFASAAVSLKSDSGPLFMLLAVALSNLDQDENAEKAYQQALNLDPSEPHTLLNYSVFLHKRGRSKEAAKYLNTAMKGISNGGAEIEKELKDLMKRLSAALNVGDRIVAEVEMPEKKKKNKSSKPKKSNVADKRRPDSEEQEAGIEKMAAPVSPSALPPLLSPLGAPKSPSKLPPLRTAVSRETGELTSDEDLASRLPEVPGHDPEDSAKASSPRAAKPLAS